MQIALRADPRAVADAHPGPVVIAMQYRVVPNVDVVADDDRPRVKRQHARLEHDAATARPELTRREPALTVRAKWSHRRGRQAATSGPGARSARTRSPTTKRTIGFIGRRAA